MNYIWRRKTVFIAVLSIAAIALHLVLRFGFHTGRNIHEIPLWTALVLGGLPLLYELGKKLLNREFGSDLLAGISIVTSIVLGEYLAGTLVVLMLSGGEALENYAVQSASSVLRALAKRMPSVAHRKSNGKVVDVKLDEVSVEDTLILFPHDICPVDGLVIEGHGEMDESFLTGEPFKIEKAPGSMVISGAINGDSALTIRAIKRAVDSRYAKIMEVMRSSEENRPRMRRLGDQLGAFYTPFAIAVALVAWFSTGEVVRFLAVLVVATPCPLIIAIPVAIIGSISLCARRGIIIKNPVVLEQIQRCRVVIFDKTGTLTYGEPKLTEQMTAPGFSPTEVLALAASLERYSKHPLASAVLAAAKKAGVRQLEAAEISEPPGQGLRGTVSGHQVQITSRGKLVRQKVAGPEHLPGITSGLECMVVIDGTYAATFRFHDAPREESVSFIGHLAPKHHFKRIMLLSGDRKSEVEYLAKEVGITEIHAEKNPEEKLAIVRGETALAKTLYVGDGINDAPAIMAATVGVAIGQNSDITAEAAGAVIMEGALKRVDELMHISHRMRTIALQSAMGGMALSVIGMIFAGMGYLVPVEGAIVQEIIDVLAVLNALRAAWRPKQLTDFDT
ncbi:heavy metal translocating P-type ATPase [Pedosphaera parvula Ellin514]|uniref:P-type Zn(2+) transporter n=2 Tax=Pedosphaera TaxID=1032526 RepID=B9XR81_PEDPL|nr:heavy metal translocating P-type ATPase [Pedosphaera parvula]EEF57694.1 heavy metal translocating P-type ATPase [Pedosphaera parvula Ellin514]